MLSRRQNQFMLNLNLKELTVTSLGELPTNCNICIVIDLSGSMSGYVESLKDAIKKIIDYSIANSTITFKFSFVYFSSNVEFKVFDESYEPEQIKQEVIETISSFTMHSTNLCGGLEKAVEIVEKQDSGISVILCLTDGYANYGVRDLGVIKMRIHDLVKEKKLQMQMVAFGQSPPLNLSNLGIVTQATDSAEFGQVVENTLGFAIQSIGTKLSITTNTISGQQGLSKQIESYERVTNQNINDLEPSDIKLFTLDIDTGLSHLYPFREYQVQDYVNLKSVMSSGQTSTQQFMFDNKGNLYYIGNNYRCYPIVKNNSESNVTYVYDTNIVNGQPLNFTGTFVKDQVINIKLELLNGEIVEIEYTVTEEDIAKDISPEYMNRLFDDLVEISIPDGATNVKYFQVLRSMCPPTAVNQRQFLEKQIQMINSGQFDTAHLSREVESSGRYTQRVIFNQDAAAGEQSSGYR